MTMEKSCNTAAEVATSMFSLWNHASHWLNFYKSTLCSVTLNWKPCLLWMWVGKRKGRDWKRLADENPPTEGAFPSMPPCRSSSARGCINYPNQCFPPHVVSYLPITSASLEWRDSLIMELLFQPAGPRVLKALDKSVKRAERCFSAVHSGETEGESSQLQEPSWQPLRADSSSETTQTSTIS